MRLVDIVDGRLELRWTWLPYWIAAGPALHTEIERLMRDVVVMNGMPVDDDSLARIHDFLIKQLARRFPIPGLDAYLQALSFVEET